MMRQLIQVFVLAACVPIVPAYAATCVGPLFDQAFPEATAVEMRYVDVPSPAFPGLWQEGIVDGYFYQIFANREAIIKERRVDPTWTITISCQEGSCMRAVTGFPAHRAQRLSDAFEICLLDGDMTVALAPPKSEESEPTIEMSLPPTPSTKKPAPEIEDIERISDLDVPEKEPCGLAMLADGGAGITLQRLLVLAGGDPGPIDGLPGKLTRGAMIDILGAESAELGTQSAILQLNALLCR